MAWVWGGSEVPKKPGMGARGRSRSPSGSEALSLLSPGCPANRTEGEGTEKRLGYFLKKKKTYQKKKLN